MSELHRDCEFDYMEKQKALIDCQEENKRLTLEVERLKEKLKLSETENIEMRKMQCGCLNPTAGTLC